MGGRISVQGANTGAVPYSVDPNTTNALLGWNYDMVSVSGAFAPAAAFIYLTKIPIPKTITITNVLIYITTAGTSYTNTQLGLYNSSGTYLAATAVLASAGTNTFGSTGIKTIALDTPQTITGGPSVFVWVGHHAGTNSATAFTVKAAADATSVGAGETAATARWAFQNGHATNNLATIGNLTPSSNNMAVGAAMTWIGIS